jgi:hypothetical protein
MATAENGEVWTGPRLAARLVALNGVAPDPVQQVIFRSSRRADGSLTEGYAVPGEEQPLDEAALELWLTRHGLAGPERLAVAVLVIHETLDARGAVVQCTIERRRGSAEGPYCGEPARVDFAGAASAVRLYRSHIDGRLTEVAPSADTPPPAVRLPEQFAGEYKALQARFGDDVRIVDAREPTLFEDMVGLSSIVHVLTSEGRAIGCGIGWHGAMPFVLEAEFPRFAPQIELLPEDAAAIDVAARTHELLLGSTRLDEYGLAVVARRIGSEALFLLRPQSGQVSVEPYLVNRDAAGPDQQRWMRYVESYEGLIVLDCWSDGAGDDVMVVTGDPSGQMWQHHIDPDGVETWRKISDDPAIGSLHREHLYPELADADDAMSADAKTDVAVPMPRFAERRTAADDSLLAKTEAYVRAMEALQDARRADGTIDLATMHLRNLHSALSMLDAHGAAATVQELLTRVSSRDSAPIGFIQELARIEDRLHDELALLRVVTVAPPRAQLLDRDDPPFGEEVAASFPFAGYDIEEAAVCLALHRPTASVFHCMKIIAHGLAAFARCSGIVDPGTAVEQDWQSILRVLHDAADAGRVELHHALDDIRRRWRATSLQPADKYTEEEAELIFLAVGKFMRALVACCEEPALTTVPLGTGGTTSDGGLASG